VWQDNIATPAAHGQKVQIWKYFLNSLLIKLKKNKKVQKIKKNSGLISGSLNVVEYYHMVFETHVDKDED
jgi:hypothetical protein